MNGAHNSTSKQRPLRALVVDDNPENASLLVEELVASHFQVTGESVETENQYLQQLLNSPPDLILSEYEPQRFSAARTLELLQHRGPSLSVLGGWWIEGHIEGVTGWCSGDRRVNPEAAADREHDALSLYEKLEHVILPMFDNQRNRFIDVMRPTIAINDSFFNTQRMLQQHVLHAYYG
jgi:glycogen phosphorylase